LFSCRRFAVQRAQKFILAGVSPQTPTTGNLRFTAAERLRK